MKQTFLDTTSLIKTNRFGHDLHGVQFCKPYVLFMGPTPYCHFIILICLSRAFVMDDDLLEIEMKIKSHFTVKILCFVVVLMFHYSNFLIATT